MIQGIVLLIFFHTVHLHRYKIASLHPADGSAVLVTKSFFR